MDLKRADEVWINRDGPGPKHPGRVHAVRTLNGQHVVLVKMKASGERRIYDRSDVAFPI
jgi:hypothetical protein